MKFSQKYDTVFVVASYLVIAALVGALVALLIVKATI